MTWQDTEEYVKRIASFIWDCEATSETIAGIKCDCIVRIKPDYWCFVEITEENSLDKLRMDIAKLFTVKHSLMGKNIFADCYFITKDKPTDSVRNSGREQNINVMSIQEFQNLYFNYRNYIYIRNQHQFGSLIDVETGEPENSGYVEVKYVNTKTGEKLSIDDIAQMLIAGKKVILKGNFGTGKSRCVKRLFDILSDSDSFYFPIAINLRDHWGALRGEEILKRHFDNLGIDSKNLIKTYTTNEKVMLLLDGFDEIGTQSWSVDNKKMQHIRSESVAGVKDLIRKSKGGILITGREHYFNSDKEMVDCLGLNTDNYIILKCQDEFSEEEIEQFLRQNHSSDISSENVHIPVWLPKRPFIVLMLVRYAIDLLNDEYTITDVCDFWYIFLNGLAERESKINPVLNPNTIKQILIQLGRTTRFKPNDVGPITMEDLSSAFEQIMGIRPNDESSIILQRLPGLGRLSADSPDRQFIDSFILNGLRAEDIIQSVNNSRRDILIEKWKNPLNAEGCIILSEYINKKDNRYKTYLAFAKQSSEHANQILSADIISALCLLDVQFIDFNNIQIDSADFSYLMCESKKICNLHISNSYIDTLDITNASFSENSQLSDCLISNVVGVPSEKGLPDEFVNCLVDSFQSIGTVSRIKKAKLTSSQKIFITIIKKVFFQHGSGRKEEALLRGLNDQSNKHITERIINKLLTEKIITKFKGDEGWVYTPERRYAGRMEEILLHLTMSHDPLWKYITSISK